ncbi:MAG: HAD family hydrolase [Leptospiraceae bacterium]|nr:HAD family hydrolase [Leptospiraceae bacterium]
MKGALLFDIDGTLLRARGMGTNAFQESFLEILGHSIDMQHVNWQGATDGEVIQALLRKHGYTDLEIELIRPRLFATYADFFHRNMLANPAQIEVIEGARELLDLVANQALGILSGNIQATAQSKLEGARLDDFFPGGIGGFGCDHDIREELYPIALKRLREHYKADFDFAVIIGDSLRDIAVAQAHSIPVLALATGHTPYQELEAAGPDLLFANYRDLPLVHGALLTLLDQ